ncbi:MAG: hypothetical protein LBC07_04970 [Elusimicrobiota bacterium]|jgi:nucleoside-diphosphate-sugar epimerase|nr:hypothetical protein [Elusimicrobiota bacterium]
MINFVTGVAGFIGSNLTDAILFIQTQTRFVLLFRKINFSIEQSVKDTCKWLLENQWVFEVRKG